MLDREPEVIVAELRPGAGVLVLPSVLLVLVAAALGFFLFRLPDGWPRWAALAGAVLLVLLGFVLPIWAWASRRYTITTRRTILRAGLVARSRREVLHARVLEVDLDRRAGQRLGGTGDVTLELGQGRAAVLRNIRSPRLVQEALTDLVEAQRHEAAARRGNTGEQPV